MSSGRFCITKQISSLNSSDNLKVYKSGDISTGLQNFNAGINASNGTINYNGNLLAGLSPTFATWTQNPGTSANLVSELNPTLTTSGKLNTNTAGEVKYDLGSSKRVIISMESHVSVGTVNAIYAVASDDNTNWYAVLSVPSVATGNAAGVAATSGVFKARYIRYLVDGGTAATIDQLALRAYNI